MEDPTRGFVARASILIHASSSRVWDALTNPELIRQYMFGATVVSEWKEGGSIVWKGEWEGRTCEDWGTLLRLAPKRLRRYPHFSPLSGLPDVAENCHTVTVRLAMERSATRVALTQDNNESEEARAHAEGSWKMMLARLKVLVES